MERKEYEVVVEVRILGESCDVIIIVDAESKEDAMLSAEDKALDIVYVNGKSAEENDE